MRRRWGFPHMYAKTFKHHKIDSTAASSSTTPRSKSEHSLRSPGLDMFELVAATPAPGSTGLENDQLCDTCQSLFDPEVIGLLNTPVQSNPPAVEKQQLLCSEILISWKTCYLCQWIVEIVWCRFPESALGRCLSIATPRDFAGNSRLDTRIVLRCKVNWEGVFSISIVETCPTVVDSMRISDNGYWIYLGRMVGTYTPTQSPRSSDYLLR